MPELPEVETVLRTLEKQIQGATIETVDVAYEPIVGNARRFKKEVQGQTFHTFRRRGKYLLFGLDSCTLVVHLRMEGKFFLKKTGDPKQKHEHVLFHLQDGRDLRYADTRKFGRMELAPLDVEEEGFHGLGLEPFDSRCTGNYWYTHLHAKTTPIKTCLLDQTQVAGIGNIYADEICFACQLDPRTRANKISKTDADHLAKETRRILQGAIRAGGTTIRSYTSSLGVTGRFQLKCKVHPHQGEPCPVCGTIIKKTVVGGRGTYYCPHCQKRK